MGVTPRGGSSTIAGPQQQSTQRKRGMRSAATPAIGPTIQGPDDLRNLSGLNLPLLPGFHVGQLADRPETSIDL